MYARGFFLSHTSPLSPQSKHGCGRQTQNKKQATPGAMNRLSERGPIMQRDYNTTKFPQNTTTCSLFPSHIRTQAGGGFFAYKRFQAGADAAFSQGLADEEGFGTATAEDGGAGYQVCSRGILDNIPMLPMYYKLQLSFPGWLHRRRDGRLRGGALLRGRADGR